MRAGTLRQVFGTTRSAGDNLAERGLRALEGAFLLCSVFAIFLLMTLICVSVLGRNLFASPVPDDIILAENLMPFIVCLPLAFVTARRGHIEVEIFTSWMPNGALNALSAFANLIGMLIFLAIAWCAWQGVLKDLATQQYYEGILQLPIWMTKLVFVLGVAVFSLRLALNAMIDVRNVYYGRIAESGELLPPD
jgi:TRAP-type C4-dicarboxylate transport system permease small subunit